MRIPYLARRFLLHHNDVIMRIPYLAHMMMMDLPQPHHSFWLGPGGRARQGTAVEPTRNKRGSESGTVSATFWGGRGRSVREGRMG